MMSSSLYISRLPDCTIGFHLYIHDFPLPEIKRLIRIIAESEVGLGEYAKSKETRMKLINAAGEIIATGGLSALTIRGVAHRAGENVSSIHYHFGNKEGLLIATVTYSISEWMKYDWQEFVKQRSGLFRDDTGKAIVIRELVDILFELSFSGDKPQWCSSMQYLAIMHSDQTADIIFTNVIEPNFSMFLEIYHNINPGCTDDEARFWAVHFMGPFVQLSVTGNTALRLLRKNSYSKDFLEKFKGYIIRSTLHILGLPEDQPDMGA
jgi:AcrR family transcriptional regulator